MATVQLSHDEKERLTGLVAKLTVGEREVVWRVVDGRSNKDMARSLGVAVRTIEARRSKIMKKLQVQTVPALVKMWIAHVGDFKLGCS